MSDKTIRCPHCGNLHVDGTDVSECEPTIEEAMVKAGVPEDRVDWLLDMARLKNEELIPVLQECVYEDDTWGPVLKHPLVFSIPLVLPGQANMAYWQKKAALDKAVEKGDWNAVIWLHERAYRLDAFIEYVSGRGGDFNEVIPLIELDEDSRALAADVWVDSENIHQHIEEWTELFSGWNPGDPMLFNDDPEGWANLPDTLTVYRAGIDDGGWSWTLDPKVAEFFAKRFGENHVMSVGKVKKECVFGYLTRRNEAEVLVPDGAVTDVRPFAGL